MSVRQPVRLLDISRITEAYPLELLADFATGNFTLLNSSGSQIEHKKPGKITVKYGQSTIVNNQDLSENIEFTIPESTSVSGNAATATKLQTPVTITVGNTGKSFDGSAPVSWSLTEIGAAAVGHNHDSDYLGIDDTAAAATKLATARTFTIGSASAKSFDGTANLTWTLSEIGAAAVGHNHDSQYLAIGGTAAAATKLATARQITIGNTSKSFDGSAAVSWTLSEIGAAAANHNHDSDYLGISDTAVAATKLATARSIGLSGVTAQAQSFDGTGNVTIPITAIPSSLLTGTIDLSLIPAGALERMVVVTSDTDRFQLTTSQVQVGDIVKVTDSGLMYYVKDQNNLSNSNGYEVYTAGYATSVPWEGISNKPTFATVATSGSYNDLTDRPTIYGPSSTTPLVASGSGSVGTGTTFARADHVHPVQTSVTGNAGTATRLATSRTLTIGDTGKSFNGSADVSWTLSEIGAAAEDHNHDDTYLGINNTAVAANRLATARMLTIGNTGKPFNGSAAVSWSLTEIGAAAEDHNHDSDYLGIDDTAAAATKLATARTFTIGSASAKSFDGTANLRWTLSEIGAAAVGHNHDSDYLGIDDTAAAATKLATARTLTIGNTGKSFNGTANLRWTLSEIGAAAASHTHSNYLSTSGGTVSGDLTIGGTLTMSTDGDVSGISVVYTATIGTSWSGSGPYTQTITVTGILATDVPVVDMRCSGTYSTDQSREEAFGQIYRIVTAANRITVYAHEKTTTSCPIRLLVVR